MKRQNCPHQLKKLGREYTANGCFRQQRARGVLPFSLLHQKRRRESAVGFGAGQQGKLTLLMKTKNDYGELAIYRRAAGYCIGFTAIYHALDELSAVWGWISSADCRSHFFALPSKRHR